MVVVQELGLHIEAAAGDLREGDVHAVGAGAAHGAGDGARVGRGARQSEVSLSDGLA